MGADSPELGWACENCPKTRASDLHPYTSKLLTIRRLRQAGYPLEANDLTYEEWLDLGQVQEAMSPGFCPLMGGGGSGHAG